MHGACLILDAPAEKSSRYLFIEIDRGTETVEPSKRNQKGHKFWRGNSILRKFVVYAHGYRTDAHTELFGIPTFQVLIVTTTPGHVEKMIEVYQKHLADEVPAIRFLFTDLETLAAHNYDVLAAPVVDGKGKERSLS